MKRILLLTIAAAFFTSCADKDTKPRGPISTSSSMPWNVPVAGQGGGAFSMLPQNQYRR